MAEENKNTSGLRKKRSIVWAHFTHTGENTVVCRHCKRTMTFNFSTTAMRVHLRRMHPTAIANGHKADKTKEKREKHSKVWNHFTLSKENRVVCLHCKRTLAYFGNTSSMLYHLRRRHPHAVTGNGCKADNPHAASQSQSEQPFLDHVEEPTAAEEKISRGRVQKRSFVWAHFTPLGEHAAVCVHCKNTLKHQWGNTSTMRTHLNRCHPTEIGQTSGQQADDPRVASQSHSEQPLNDHVEETTKMAEKIKRRYKKREKHSLVWNHFTLSKENRVVCLYCKRTLIYFGNTSSMLYHLRRRHPHVITRNGSKADDPHAASQLKSEQPFLDHVEEPTAAEEKISRGRVQKHSFVWAHFTPLGEHAAVCVHCKNTLKRQRGNTSTMCTHLNRCHPTEIGQTSGQQADDPHLASQSHSEQPLNDHVEETIKMAEKIKRRYKKREKHSLVWNHFTLSKENRVICLYCKRTLIYFGNTSSMLYHLRKQHPHVITGNGCKMYNPCAASESKQKALESERASNDHHESNQLLKLQMEKLQSRLEEKERELTEAFKAYKTLHESVWALKKDMGAMQKQLNHQTGKYQDANQVPTSPSSTVLLTPPSLSKYEVCDDLPLLTLTCTSEPNSPGIGDAEELPQRSSKDQEVTIIGLLTPHSTAVANSNEILEYMNMHTQASAICTSPTNPTDPSGSVGHTERSPPPLMLKTLSVRLEDCRHKLGPDLDVFFVQEKNQHGRQDEEVNKDDCGGNDQEDPDYNPEDDVDSDENPDSRAQQTPAKDTNNTSATDNMKNNTGDIYSCTLCNEKFTKIYYMKLHRLIHDKDVTVDQCLSEPMKYVKIIKPFQCEVCGNQKLHNGENIHYERDESGRKLCKCGARGKPFRDSVLRRIHQGAHLGERPYICSWCKKTFIYPSNLRVHERWHCKKGSNKVDAYTRCPKSSHQKHSQEVHETSHSERETLECSICDDRFTHAACLRKHLKSHAVLRPYLCDICGKAFERMPQLQIHLLIHTGEKPHKCSVCSKRFRLRQSLTRHSLNHSEDSPFHCPICNKRFTSLELTKRHERVHTKEKPFHCYFCGKNFGYKESLYIHQKRFHFSSGPVWPYLAKDY